MLKYCDKFYFFLLLQLFGVINHGHSFVIDNSERVLGDSCDLENNQFGVCMKITKCEYAKKLVDMEKISEIKYCYFLTGEPVVCCPKCNGKFNKALCIGKKINIDLTTNIVNGKKAEVGEFPHQAALGYRNELEPNKINFDCGGSLIADDIVLTAAHCVNRINRTAFMVRLGRTSLDLNDTEDYSIVQDIDIEKIELHSSYSTRIRQNDIALIKLKHPVTISEFVKPICLSSKNDNIPERLTITGFGRINPNTAQKSDWLLKGDVKEYPFAECKRLVKDSKIYIVESQICALNKTGVDGCQGDSGGPMIYDNGVQYLYGITSFGNGCGSNVPGIYTRVDKFLDWIEEKMSLLC